MGRMREKVADAICDALKAVEATPINRIQMLALPGGAFHVGSSETLTWQCARLVSVTLSAPTPCGAPVLLRGWVKLVPSMVFTLHGICHCGWLWWALSLVFSRQVLGPCRYVSNVRRICFKTSRELHYTPTQVRSLHVGLPTNVSLGASYQSAVLQQILCPRLSVLDLLILLWVSGSKPISDITRLWRNFLLCKEASSLSISKLLGVLDLVTDQQFSHGGVQLISNAWLHSFVPILGVSAKNLSYIEHLL